ncbi:MAG: hypothetical protein JJW03_05265 [Desulfosarcina sp.]|nr:hypothetical protein [Desulfobacterales bacterium]
MKIIIILFLFFNSVSLCYSAPVISDIAGENPLIITGTGFQAKTISAPIIWDDFEWGTAGNDLDTNPTVSDRWSIHNPGLQEISTGEPHAGTKSAKWNFYVTDPYDEQKSFRHVYRDNIAETQEMYASYWVYTSNNAASVGKYARIQVAPVYSGNPVASLRGAPVTDHPELHRLYFDVSNDNEDPHWLTPEAYKNNTVATWHRIEMYFRLSNPPGAANGAAYATINGTYIDAFYDNLITRSTGDNRLLTTFMLGQGLTYPDKSVNIFIDDVYVDNTRARVEIGNAATWSACTHREIQIPVTWSTTEITATINQGSFSSVNGKYLFIIDADGIASDGYKIQLQTATISSIGNVGATIGTGGNVIMEFE